jgi:Zn-dependent peptidase ImmA (M78 family)
MPHFDWTQHRARACKQADSLVARAGVREAPVPLLDVAAAVGSAIRVRFQPLLVAGATAVHESGFRIYCGCKSSEAKKWDRSFHEPSDGGRSLPKRLRFTLAHEIMHTLFYEATDSGLRSLVPHATDRDIEKLERSCDAAAGHILIPEFLLSRSCRQANLLSAVDLAGLCDLFRVSPEALLLRLAPWGSWDQMGAAAVVRQRGTELEVATSVGNGVAKRILPELRSGARLQDLSRVSDSSMTLFGGVSDRADVTLRGSWSEQPCLVTCRVISHSPLTFIVALDLRGAAQVTT